SRRAEDQQRFGAAGVAQRQQQPGYAEDVVAVHVADEHEVDVLDAPALRAQADLRRFATVQQDQVLALAHQHARQRRVRQWHHAARPEQRQIEHHWQQRMQLPDRRRVKVLLLALALDAAFGEPPNALHPVAWLGRLLSWLEPLTPNPPTPRAE